MAFPKLSLKLLVDKKGERVLFAEASKDFVDFFYHIFSLPLGTLIELLGSKNMVGCLGKLKDSIETFNGIDLQHDIREDDIFNLNSAFNEKNKLLLPCNDKPIISSKMLYGCSSFHNDEMNVPMYIDQEEDDDESDEAYDNDASCEKYVTDHLDALCPSCNSLMNAPLNYVAPSNKTCTSIIEDWKEKKKSWKGYVKEPVTYMVLDDLEVKSMSSISTISFIKDIGVKDLSHLEEKIVTFENAEGCLGLPGLVTGLRLWLDFFTFLKLLKASLITDKVLTTVFLQNNLAYE
uniref:uncharacterized protein LOC122589438 n=1 Tax=Erigeron canadensis TaxID=72917 RepID=UPI001CB8F707|nr:uncharacterized protein LOC122589438 [Erigeron canadensis]